MTTTTVRRHATRRMGLAVGLALAASASSLACSGGSSSKPKVDTVDVYLQALPDWSVFAPLRSDEEPHAVGEPGDPQQKTVGDKQFVCATTPYAVQRTPHELVMYSPNVEILWPGSLIQGRSYRDGDSVDALLALTIAERTPIKVSIPALKTTDNFREVVPDQANVHQAIGSMIGAATEGDLKTPSTTSFTMEAYHSEEQFALSVGLSGRYMGFSAKANFSLDQSAEETTVVVHFAEKMFEVVVAPPQTPGAFFSDAFTQAKLDEQVALGRIGPDNLPVYVSNVVYGRMFTFAMTSTKSEQEMRAALQAAYSFGAGEVSTEISAEHKKLIEESRIAITSMGGTSQATLDVIRSGDWRAYFAAASPLSGATPLSYTFRNLADGAVALVTETATYGRTVCDAVLVPGFLDVQPVSLQLATPFSGASGDLNGDGRMDLVWNHRGGTNDVRVGFGKSNGTFDLATSSTTTIAATPAGGWTDFALVVADVTGDGMDDLVWNRVTAGKSETYVAASKGDGTFELLPADVRTEAEWTPGFAVMAARVQAKTTTPAARDLLWNRVAGTTSTVFGSVFGGAAPSHLAPQALSPFTILNIPIAWSYASFGTMLADITGDGADDLVWGVLVSGPGVLPAVNDGAGAFVKKGPVGSGPWPCANYNANACGAVDAFRLADATGDGKADALLWERDYVYSRYCPSGCAEWMCDIGDDIGGACRRTYYHYSASQLYVSNGVGGFSITGTQNWPVMPVDPELRDVSGDGKADLVWVELGTAAKLTIAVAQTNASGGFTGFGAQAAFQPKTALPPGSTSWANYRAYYGDVDGDGRADVVLNDASTVANIYVLIR